MSFDEEDPPCYQCPGCHCVMQPSFFGDVHGGSHWTDGYRSLDTDDELIPVYQCPACTAIHWLVPSRVDRKSLHPTPSNEAPVVRPPAEPALLAAIEKGLAADREGEFIARRLAWWRSNDLVRDDAEVALPPRGPLTLTNMEWLLDHAQRTRPAGEHAYGRLGDFLEVELLRELERFDEALARLTAIASIEFTSPKKNRLVGVRIEYWTALCRARDSKVKLME